MSIGDIFSKKYYYGDKRITETKEIKKEVAGRELDYLEITLEDGSKEIILARIANDVILEKRTDMSAARDNRYTGLLKEILTLFAEHDIAFADFPFITSMLTKSMQEFKTRATLMLWGKEFDQVRISDADKAETLPVCPLNQEITSVKQVLENTKNKLKDPELKPGE